MGTRSDYRINLLCTTLPAWVPPSKSVECAKNPHTTDRLCPSARESPPVRPCIYRFLFTLTCSGLTPSLQSQGSSKSTDTGTDSTSASRSQHPPQPLRAPRARVGVPSTPSIDLSTSARSERLAALRTPQCIVPELPHLPRALAANARAHLRYAPICPGRRFGTFLQTCSCQAPTRTSAHARPIEYSPSRRDKSRCMVVAARGTGG